MLASTKYKFVKFNINKNIAIVSLNRPEKRNALNNIIINELKDVLSLAEKNDNVKIIILKGEGKVFCAGADLQYLQQLQNNTFEDNIEDSTNLMELFYQIYTLKKIVIAQVHGAAIAGGCGLATVCDFIFSSSDCKFGYTEVKIGFVPAIVSSFLIRRVGESIAKELLLTGKIIDANTAYNYHIVNKIFDKSVLEKETLDFANKIIKNCSQQSISITKHLINEVQDKVLKDALIFSARENAKSRLNNDCKRGISAFLNKKQITW